MKFETLKSIILVFLIVVSLFLTFSMWKYQPSVESLSDAQPEDISLNGSEESIRTLVDPKQVIFQQDGEHYTFFNQLDQRSFFQHLQNAILYDLETVNIDNTLDGYDVEIIFPTAIPMAVIGNLFTFSSTDYEFPVWSFQKMFLTMDKEMRIIRVDFLSVDERTKATALIQDRSDYEEFNKFLAELEYRELTQVELQDGEVIYIPEGKIELPRRTVAFSKINENDLVDVLFADPSIVRQSNYSNRGTTYFTDSSQMSVSQDESIIQYIRPGAINEYYEPLHAESLLTNSISNINAYKGWTDVYKLFSIDTSESTIRYQMFFQGYPVFSSLAQIEQRWGQRLIEYTRPLFRSNNALNENYVTLPSSEEVIRYVEENYSLDDIVDIQVGYHLEYEKDKNIIIFEPSWFLKQGFSRNWIPIQPD